MIPIPKTSANPFKTFLGLEFALLRAMQEVVGWFILYTWDDLSSPQSITSFEDESAPKNSEACKYFEGLKCNSEKPSWFRMRVGIGPEANPQEILDRGESITLPPMFILQGDLDDNVLPETQAHFVASYRDAGGEIDFEVFAGAEHRWVHSPSPQTDRAIAMMKDYIATRLGAMQPAA